MTGWYERSDVPGLVEENCCMIWVKWAISVLCSTFLPQNAKPVAQE
jgi:hypothetical protein